MRETYRVEYCDESGWRSNGGRGTKAEAQTDARHIATVLGYPARVVTVTEQYEIVHPPSGTDHGTLDP